MAKSDGGDPDNGLESWVVTYTAVRDRADPVPMTSRCAAQRHHVFLRVGDTLDLRR